VRDVTKRRGDGRPSHAEPLKAFQAVLAKKGDRYFEQWWSGLREELLRAETAMPTSAIVLCAALCEGSLSLIADGDETVASRMKKSERTRWSIPELAKAFHEHGIIKDATLVERCNDLNTIRQRIHAGRILSERQTYPRPDARPEEARRARETLDQVVRCLVEWLSAATAEPTQS
jgi:hypothetical protein